MSVFLQRQGRTQTVSVEVHAGLDGQGKPSYDLPIDIKARVIRKVEVARGPDGSEIRTMVSLWVAGDQVPLPNENDRIDLGSSEFVIVVERNEQRHLQTQDVIDHVMLKAREE